MCINGSRQLNGKPSIDFNTNRALFRKELSMEGNTDTEVPWEFQNKGIS